jgi:hypothetical protein
MYWPDVAVKRFAWLRRMLDRRLFGAGTVVAISATSKGSTGKHAVDGSKEQGLSESKGGSKDKPLTGASKQRVQSQISEQGSALAIPSPEEQGRPVFDSMMDRIAAYMNGDTIDLARVPADGEQVTRGARSKECFSWSDALVEQVARGGEEQGARPLGEQGWQQGQALDGSKEQGLSESKGKEQERSSVSNLFSRRRRAGSKESAGDLVRRYYGEQRAEGVPPEKIFGAAAAKYVKENGRGLTISRQGANEVIKGLRAKESDEGARREA